MGVIDGTLETAGGGIKGGIKWGVIGLATAALVIGGGIGGLVGYGVYLGASALGASGFFLGLATVVSGLAAGVASVFGASAFGATTAGFSGAVASVGTVGAAIGATVGAAKGLNNNISRQNPELQTQIDNEIKRSEQISVAEQHLANRQAAASGFDNPTATNGHTEKALGQAQVQKPQLAI